MITPALLLMGIAAIASPIIIHLLNKRKFKRVDWAAMDFLLEADKKNRRRVRLENLLLLLLRCLACVLIGLLLARPIKSLLPTGDLLETKGYERIVVLDDSLSMAVKTDSRSSMETAKKSLIKFVTDLAGNNTQDDFTLYLTSDPKHPKINAKGVNDQSAGSIVADIEETVHVSDKPSDLAGTLREVEKGLKSRKDRDVSYVVYVISDMRALDWPHDDAAVADGGVINTLKRMADDERAVGCYLVDVGRPDDAGNVYVEEIRSKEKALVAGVRSEFEITVRNTGKSDVNDAQVRFRTEFTKDESQELPIDLPKIPAGGSASQSFNYTFVRDEFNATADETQTVRIDATVESPQTSGINELAEDDTRHFAARVVPGVKTLIVDGDRTGRRDQWESFYVAKALTAPGNAVSGVVIDVVTETQFETLRLDDYQVIYLCNLYRVPDAGQASARSETSENADEGNEDAGGILAVNNRMSRMEELEGWVRDGGGLIIALGDQADPDIFNQQFYKDGAGLSPIKLEEERGDPEKESWYHFNVTGKHPVMEAFTDDVFANYVKVFRWWQATIAEKDLESGSVNVIARLTNPDSPPVVVEKRFGDGGTIVFATPLSYDWSDWPADQWSFVPTMLELNKYMARKTADEANVQVGDSLHAPLDVTRYELLASVNRPDGEKGEPEVTHDDTNSSDQSLYQVSYDDVDRQGFYDIVLTRSESAGPQHVLFAANINPREGNLARAGTDEFTRKLGDSRVKLVTSDTLNELGVNEAKKERWRIVLVLLLVVLCSEQALGWWFGRKR